MRNNHKKKWSMKIGADELAEISFVLFWANPVLRIVFAWLLGGANSVSVTLSLIITYFPLFLAVCKKPSKYIKIDFIVLYISIIYFFGFTLLMHPEYLPYYKRDEYGVWDHVLIPYRGIYAYLFIRILNNPNRIIANMKKAGWIMFTYFVYQIILFYRRGYWYGIVGTNNKAKMSYSVSFGYEVLLFALVFLYCAFKEKKISDVFAAGLCIAMILLGGSRGPVLFVGIFIILYFIKELQQSRKKIIIVTGFSGITMGIYLFYNSILLWVSSFLNQFGFSSRFITKLLEGNISSDSGRSKIWQATIEMIKEHPWGYGAMGTRHIITNYIYTGYPHSIILEILVDFGVFFGAIILLVFLIYSMLFLFSVKRREWSGVFLIFFCAACCLFLSLTYWSITSFWGCLGIGVCGQIMVKYKVADSKALKN